MAPTFKFAAAFPLLFLAKNQLARASACSRLLALARACSRFCAFDRDLAPYATVCAPYATVYAPLLRMHPFPHLFDVSAPFLTFAHLFTFPHLFDICASGRTFVARRRERRPLWLAGGKGALCGSPAGYTMWLARRKHPMWLARRKYPMWLARRKSPYAVRRGKTRKALLDDAPRAHDTDNARVAGVAARGPRDNARGPASGNLVVLRCGAGR
jgi:hypothetical protein